MHIRLTCSAMHRCFPAARHQPVAGYARRQAHKAVQGPPDRLHQIDTAEIRTEEGNPHLYVGVDRESKFAFAQLHDKADRPAVVAFLKALFARTGMNLHPPSGHSVAHLPEASRWKGINGSTVAEAGERVK